MTTGSGSDAVAGGPARHIPVLARPAVDWLAVKPGGLYVDATFGAVVFVGYHAAEGRPAATLSHSFSGTIEVELDGVPVPRQRGNKRKRRPR